MAIQVLELPTWKASRTCQYPTQPSKPSTDLQLDNVADVRSIHRAHGAALHLHSRLEVHLEAAEQRWRELGSGGLALCGAAMLSALHMQSMRGGTHQGKQGFFLGGVLGAYAGERVLMRKMVPDTGQAQASLPSASPAHCTTAPGAPPAPGTCKGMGRMAPAALGAQEPAVGHVPCLRQSGAVYVSGDTHSACSARV